MRLLLPILLMPLAACSMTMSSGNQAQPANTSAPNAAVPAAMPDAAHAPANGLIPAQPGKDAPPGNGSAPAGDDGTGGRELRPGAANLDFVIVNRTGQTIRRLEISPAGEESWSDNILAQREVPNDERAAASYTRDYEVCAWDVRVTYEGGGRRSWPGINLCDTVRVELR